MILSIKSNMIRKSWVCEIILEKKFLKSTLGSTPNIYIFDKEKFNCKLNGQEKIWTSWIFVEIFFDQWLEVDDELMLEHRWLHQMWNIDLKYLIIFTFRYNHSQLLNLIYFKLVNTRLHTRDLIGHQPIYIYACKMYVFLFMIYHK